MPRLRAASPSLWPSTSSAIANNRKSRLHADESNLYPAVGEEFAKHETVKHSAKEYVRDDVHTNSADDFFGIFKRGMTGVYHHFGEQHLHLPGNSREPRRLGRRLGLFCAGELR